MMFTEEQIIQSLPPALQGDLKQFGALEAKSSDELRQFLLTKREQYNLPPWHAFTLLMKRAAIALGESRKLSRHNSWYLVGERIGESESNYTLEATKDAPWCYINVTGTNNSGCYMEGKVAVSLKGGFVWRIDSETKCNGDQVQCGTGSGSAYRQHMTIRARKLISVAKSAIGAGNACVDFQYAPTKSGPLRRTKAQPVVVELPEKTKPASKSVAVPAVAQRNTVSEAQKEIIRTLLDMAAVKAEELNMGSTIMRWRHALSDITEQEESND